MWMNEHEIDEVAQRHSDHPIAGPATATLAGLVAWTNRNSDGWPYWQKPARAADKLMDLVKQHDYWDRSIRHLANAEATEVALKAALRPLKAFRTKQGADFPIFESVADVEAEIEGRRAAAETTERAELARLQAKYTDV